MARRVVFCTLTAVAALGLAGCGNSNAGSSSSKARVTVESSPFGKILANANGYTLYSLSADTAHRSVCTGSCTLIWPPLSGTAPGAISSQLHRSFFGDLSLSSGGDQLSYRGHPLYTYKGDTGKDQTHGVGIKSNGGTWGVISATTGKLITTSGSTSTSTSQPYSNGY